jgi:valyl-tRNA synthetase
MIADWPEPHPELQDQQADAAFGQWIDAMEGARSSLPAIEMGHAYRAVLDPGHRSVIGEHLSLAATLTRTRVRLDDADGLALVFERDPARRTAHGEDPDAFRDRQGKRLSEVRRKIEREQAKLENEAFLSKASPEAVEKARRKLRELQEDERRLSEQLAMLGR